MIPLSMEIALSLNLSPSLFPAAVLSGSVLVTTLPIVIPLSYLNGSGNRSQITSARNYLMRWFLLAWRPSVFSGGSCPALNNPLAEGTRILSFDA